MSQREGRGNDDGRVRRPETKSFILTSEFWVAAAAAAAVFLAGYALDDIAKTTAWRYGVWIAIAYIISRGIAKAGSQRSYESDSGRSDSFVRDRRDDRFRGERFRGDGPSRPAPEPAAAPVGGSESPQRADWGRDAR